MRHFKRTGFCRTMEENGKIKTVLCYGDSNTWGYMPETDGRFPWEVRWPGIPLIKHGYNIGFQRIRNLFVIKAAFP